MGSKETNVRLDIQGHGGRTNVASVIIFLRYKKSIKDRRSLRKKGHCPFLLKFVSDDLVAVFYKHFVENSAGEKKRPYFPVIVLNGRFLY